MNVWIQLHDFSSEDLKDPSSENALKLYNEFDWDSEILKEENANAEGIECCDPGMGFVSDDHSILHLVPTSTGAMVHYHFRKAGRFLGLFPTVRDEAISVTDYPSEEIQDLVLEHYRGNQRSVKELLSEFGNEAAEASSSVSERVNQAIREALSEDLDDLQAFRDRESEPTMDFESFLKRMRSDGRL